jgi:hypothetical protein
VRFLWDLCKCIFRNIDRTNDDIGLEFDNAVSIDPASFEEISPEDKLQSFLQHQNLLPQENVERILHWIDEIRSILLNLPVNQIESDQEAFAVDLEILYQILDGYDEFLKDIKPFIKRYDPNGFLDFDWYDIQSGQKRNISSGEKAYLDLFSRLYHAKLQIDDRVWKDPKKHHYPDTLYILIDEGELGFHIRWQQEYVRRLIEFLPKIFDFGESHRPQIQLIFTTHSPISLSDIPNDHVIYLQKDKYDGQCKVLSDNEKPDRSFAANIHHIMRQSFFMDEGFVGEFAKAKINDLLKWLNNNDDQENWKDHERVIEKLIDEPLLKQKLQMMLELKKTQRKRQ